jgi:hypothetical protein
MTGFVCRGCPRAAQFRAQGRALLTVTDKARRRIAEFRDLRAELAGRALARLSNADRKALAEAGPRVAPAR